jgi:hypothetical protein
MIELSEKECTRISQHFVEDGCFIIEAPQTTIDLTHTSSSNSFSYTESELEMKI